MKRGWLYEHHADWRVKPEEFLWLGRHSLADLAHAIAGSDIDPGKLGAAGVRAIMRLKGRHFAGNLQSWFCQACCRAYDRERVKLAKARAAGGSGS